MKGPAFARLRAFRTTATREFSRLLAAGEGALFHLPEQHWPTVRELLAKHRLTEADVGRFECTFELKLEHGFWRPQSDWLGPKAAEKLPPEALAAIGLALMFSYIESGQYRSQPLVGRLVIRNEILRLWWSAFVIPELKQRGVSEDARDRRSRTNSRAGSVSEKPLADQAKELLKKGFSRDAAKDKLAGKAGDSQVNRALAEAGYIATRGRKKTRDGDA